MCIRDSPYGAQHFLDALFKNGESEYGLQLLTSRGDRSWTHWIYDLGSTITLEAWDFKYKPNMDWNHSWGSAPGNIIAHQVMGIQPIKPGFELVRIKPQIANTKMVKIKYHTIRGDILLSIKNDLNNQFYLELNIPANMAAEIYFPKYFSNQTIQMNGEEIYHIEDGNFLIIRNVGSGLKKFKIFKI